MYICITEVDAVTKIVCTAEPQRTGPSMPAVKGYTPYGTTVLHGLYPQRLMAHTSVLQDTTALAMTMPTLPLLVYYKY